MPFLSNAQQKKGIEYSGFFDSYYWRGPLSVTGGIGLAMYNGDLCSDFTCTKPSPYFTLGVGYKLWPKVFIGGELDYFGLNGKDKHASRGFEFTSKNIEIAGYINFYLVEDIIRRHSDLNKKTKMVKPYVYLGISAMRFDVTDNVGEINSPKFTGLVPVGLGVLFDITPRINVKVDAVYKIGFSDYLDGVSERANPDANDAYGMARIKLVYTPKARRRKPKKIKVDPAEREKWNQIMNGGGDTTNTDNSTPDVDATPDPDENDSYYLEDEDADQNDALPEEDSYYYEEEETATESEESLDEETETDEVEEEVEEWNGDW